MRRRGGGGGGQTPPGTSNELLGSGRIFSHSIRTILFTSLIWIAILLLSLFVSQRYSSSNHCSQTSLVKSKTTNDSDSLALRDRFQRHSAALDKSSLDSVRIPILSPSKVDQPTQVRCDVVSLRTFVLSSA